MIAIVILFCTISMIIRSILKEGRNCLVVCNAYLRLTLCTKTCLRHRITLNIYHRVWDVNIEKCAINAPFVDTWYYFYASFLHEGAKNRNISIFCWFFKYVYWATREPSLATHDSIVYKNLEKWIYLVWKKKNDKWRCHCINILKKKYIGVEIR